MPISKLFEPAFKRIYDQTITAEEKYANIDVKANLDQIQKLLPSTHPEVQKYVGENATHISLDVVDELRALIKRLFPVTDNYKDTQYFNTPDYEIYKLLSDNSIASKSSGNEVDEVKQDLDNYKTKLINSLTAELSNIEEKLKAVGSPVVFITSEPTFDDIMNTDKLTPHFNITLFSDDSDAYLSYHYDGDKIIVDDETDIADTEELSEQDKITYMKVLNFFRTGKLPSNEPLKLFRYMSGAEYKDWVRTNRIPVGKYFTDMRTNAYAPDFANIDHSDSEVYQFKVPANCVAQTQQNVYQLVVPCSISGSTLVPIKESFMDKVNRYKLMLESVG